MPDSAAAPPWRTIIAGDAARPGAQREPDADLPCPLADDVRHRAVDADDAEHQRHRRGNRQQVIVNAICAAAPIENLLHRPHLRDREIRVDRGHGCRRNRAVRSVAVAVRTT